MKLIVLLLFTHLVMALPAKDFTLENQNKESLGLSSFKGKYIVLEWYNHGCPFVRKHYDSNNMQRTQKKILKDKRFVWLTIVSSAIGKQGYLNSAKEAKERLKYERSASNHLLRDPQGLVGTLYKAKTTPQIVIISPDFNIIYNGAIDSIPSADKSDIKGATNYILKAFEDIQRGRKVKISKTRPYGCSVKY